MKAYQHEVKYYECDRMGITHHSNYVRFMEEARVDWMDQIGYGFERMEAEGVVSPVVSVECNFKRPTTFKDVAEDYVRLHDVDGRQSGFYGSQCALLYGERQACEAGGAFPAAV